MFVCPHGPKTYQAPNADAKDSTSKGEPKPSAKGFTGMNMGDEAEDPFWPLVFEDELLGDSNLDDILNKESGVFLVEIKMVELLPLEFWRARGQPKEIEGDIFAEEAKWVALTESEN